MKDYTHAEAAPVLNLSVDGVKKAAKKNRWGFRKRGNVYLFDAQDILEYRDHGHRTTLAKELGWAGRGKFRDDNIDIECPEPGCGAFAIEWPPMEPVKFKCLNGHEGKVV